LKKREIADLQQLPATYLICYLNGFEDAKDKLDRIRPLLKPYDPSIYNSVKESQRILRKVKYA